MRERRISTMVRFGVITMVLVGINLAMTAKAQNVEAPKEELVFESNFAESVSRKRWSETSIQITPVGERAFLGEFGRFETLSFSLDELPKHEYVRFQCKLLLLKAPDGSRIGSRADMWQLSDDSGAILLRTSFDNGFFKDGEDPRMVCSQSYPDEEPFGRNAPWTGAAEKLDFGYKKAEGAPNLDAVYDIDLTFPHTAGELGLSFATNYNLNTDHESWGIESARVSVVSGPRSLGGEQVSKLYAAIRGDDAVAANAAVWKLIASDERSLGFLEAELKATEKKESLAAVARREKIRAAFEEMLAGLMKDSFKLRKVAMEQMNALGQDALPLIEARLARGGLDPEQVVRLKQVQKQLEIKGEGAVSYTQEDLVGSRIHHVLRIAALSSPTAAKMLALKNGQPSADGSIELPARTTLTRGAGRRPFLMTGPEPQMEYWYNFDATLNWDLEGLKAGDYDVQVSFSAVAGQGGDDFEVRFSDTGDGRPATLKGVIEESGDWTKHVPQSVGRVSIGANAGRIRVTLQGTKKVGWSVAGFSKVRLVPVKE